MKLIIVVAFLLLLAVIVLAIWGIAQAALAVWKWRSDSYKRAIARRRAERLELEEEDRRIDELLERTKEHKDR